MEGKENKMKNEIAWLIERPLNGGSLYFGGINKLVNNENAVRFSRELDAKKVLNLLNLMELLPEGNYIVTEHIWMI
jgi:hypothetical protein